MIRTLKVKDLTQRAGILESEDIKLKERELSNVADFLKIPKSLLAVDKKYGTNTFKDVLSRVTDTVMINQHGNEIHVLDPKSLFVPDTQFEQIVSMGADVLHVEPQIKKQGEIGQMQAIFELNSLDSDEVYGDVYKRRVAITRNAQGGLDLNTGILRLICSNGAVVKEKELGATIRRVNEESIHAIVNDHIANASYV